MITLTLIIIGAFVALAGAVALTLANLYTIVPADFADVVIQGGKMSVYSSHKDYNTEGKSAYFHIPRWFFMFNMGMVVHRMPLKIISIEVPNFLAFDKDRARFICEIICYVHVTEPLVAAKRFSGDVEEMQSQVSLIVQAITRDVTTKKPIREIINNRDDIIRTVSPTLAATIKDWGISLNTIELIDFKDPDPAKDGIESHVIEDISQIIEKSITSEMRQKNAEQDKAARFKEAEAEQDARTRELVKEEAIKKREQDVLMNVAVQQKAAKEKELEVARTVAVTNAEIEKSRQLILAAQQKEVEAINKEQKKLIGEGDRAQQEEQAKGAAAMTREQGYAEADAKEKLQAALNKFGDEAIRALVAEKMVEAWKDVGVAGAKALETADVRVMSGGNVDAFNTGAMIESTRTASQDTAKAQLNQAARKLDLGFTQLFGTEEPGKERKKKNA